MSTKSSSIRSCAANFVTQSWKKTPSSTTLSGTSKSRVSLWYAAKFVPGSRSRALLTFAQQNAAEPYPERKPDRQAPTPSQELEFRRSARQSVAGFCLTHHLRLHRTALSSTAREHRDFDPLQIRCSAQQNSDEPSWE